MFEEYTVRRAMRSDSQGIWEARNDPGARSVSHNQEAISFESHDAWFENKYFKSNDHRCYVLTLKDKVCGYCRFDHGLDKGVLVLSIALHSEFQGMGLGKFFLAEALNQLDLKGDIESDVQNSNQASIGLMEKCGFTKLREDGAYAYYRLERK